MTLPIRQLGPFQVSAIGLGCMNLSHAYGTPPPMEQSAGGISRAIELGINHLDTAALYGFGANESLLGNVLSHVYGPPPTMEQSAGVISRAIELGINHLDTAALYGFGVNESLLGKVLG